MAVPMAAIGAGMAASSIAGGLMANRASSKASKEAAAQQAAALAFFKAQSDKAVRELEAVGIPSIEAQRIVMDNPQLVGTLTPEQLSGTAMEDVSTDPRLREAQMAALTELQGLSQTGLSDVDRMGLEQVQRQVAGQDQARQSSILQQMAERGQGGSGAELAARLASSQGSMELANQQAMQIADQAQRARMAALTGSADLASGLRNQDFSQDESRARALDAVDQFNLLQRSDASRYNLGQSQNLENQRSALANQQEMYNKGLLQQDYQNRYQKAADKGNLYTGQGAMGMQAGNNLANIALAKGQAQAQGWQSVGKGVSQGIGSLGSMGGSIGQSDFNQGIDNQMAQTGTSTFKKPW